MATASHHRAATHINDPLKAIGSGRHQTEIVSISQICDHLVWSNSQAINGRRRLQKQCKPSARSPNNRLL